jgi:TolB-like protein
MKKFIEELKRRHVIKASLAYLVVAWVLLEVFSFLLPMFEAPEWVLEGITLLIAIGLPIWIVISWIYDISPKGIKKTSKDSDNELKTELTNKRLNVFIIVSLSIAVVVLTWNLSFFSSDSDERYSIAVLPFEEMNVDENNDWIIKGLTIDIHTYLSKIENLTIISERSVKEALESKKSLSEIAKLLNVTHFIGGSVRQFNNDIKINVYLTKVSNDKDQWVGNYNRNLDNPFEVQQDVSQKIVAQLKVELTPEEEKTLRKFPTENMEAYELFTKGSLLNDTRNKEDLELSIDLFEQAIFLDPNFADAYAEIAKSYLNLRFSYDKEGVIKAKEYIVKALNIDINNAIAYAVRGDLFDYEQNWEKSKENYEIALALNPNNAWIHYLYAKYYGTKPIPDKKKSLYHLRIAHRIDPLDSGTAADLIIALMYNEKLKEAEENLNKLGFLFSLGMKTWLEINLEVFKAKDWTAEIGYWEREIEKEPSHIDFCYHYLSKAYDHILNDDINAIKYVKRAYELDSTRTKYSDAYYYALLDGKKFNKAKKLSQTKNFRALYKGNKGEQLVQLWMYYYCQENYKKTEELLNDSIMPVRGHDYYFGLLTYAQLGDRKKVDRSLKNHYSMYGTRVFNKDMALVYAILKEKDSMYYYLEKLRPIKGFLPANSRGEFDPYRKEERFKALLKKHYLPITHWNE